MTRSVTTTAIVDGIVAGGLALFPPDDVKLPPHVGGVLDVEAAKPLKLFGAAPPESIFSCAHWLPQKVTALPIQRRSVWCFGRARLAIEHQYARGEVARHAARPQGVASGIVVV